MDLSSESFERLLNWLHPDRDEAGKEYQRIRMLLIKKFQSHGYSDPHKLADATMDRAAQTLTTERIENWVGAKERYFYRVAYYILLEERDRRIPEMQIPDGFEFEDPDVEGDRELKLQCLEQCSQELSKAEQELIVKYYRGNKSTKIKNHEELARELNLTLPLLRVQAFRIRKKLRKCIERCLEEAARSRKPSLRNVN